MRFAGAFSRMARKGPFGREQLSTASDVVNRWSVGVAQAVNARICARTCGCICVSAPWRFGRGAGVLSVAKLTLGQEAYYEQQVAGGLDDYYAGRGESPGLWAGRGADGLGLARGRRRRRPRDAPSRRRPGGRRAAALAGARADDHGAHARRRDRRVAGRAEAARAGVRLRPRLLVPEERQPAARADRRRAGPARDERGARDGLAGGARLPRARGVRRPPRPRRRGPRARRRASSPRRSDTAPAGRRTRTCTPT